MSLFGVSAAILLAWLLTLVFLGACVIIAAGFAFRRHTLLPLDDCLYALQATIPHLTRSSIANKLARIVFAILRGGTRYAGADA